MFNKIWGGHYAGLPIALFYLANSLLFRIFDSLSTWAHCANLGSCGRGSIIQYGTSIRHPKNISLGSRVHIGRRVCLGAEILGSLKLEDDVKINKDCHIDFSGGVVIGKNSLLSQGVMIQSHTHGTDPRSQPEGIALEISENVWIGAQAVILHNVRRIGRGSIVAAGAIVTKPVPDGVIVGGNPARIICAISDVKKKSGSLAT